MVYTLRFFSLQNAVCFIILTYLVPVLFILYIQSVLKLKNNSGAKKLTYLSSLSLRRQFLRNMYVGSQLSDAIQNTVSLLLVVNIPSATLRHLLSAVLEVLHVIAFWRRNFFYFSTPCI